MKTLDLPKTIVRNVCLSFLTASTLLVGCGQQTPITVQAPSINKNNTESMGTLADWNAWQASHGQLQAQMAPAYACSSSGSWYSGRYFFLRITDEDGFTKLFVVTEGYWKVYGFQTGCV